MQRRGGGARIWLNPPYGKDAIPFLRKMREHVADNGGSGCCLIFGRTETKYFKEEIFPFADSLFFITGRLRFCNADGEPQGTCALPNVIVSYTKADTRIVARSGIDGALFKPVDRNGVV